VVCLLQYSSVILLIVAGLVLSNLELVVTGADWILD
jgi:hypothetical protein